MKVLIAILSCHALRDYEQSLRDTWIQDIPAGVDYRFVLGNPAAMPEADEVFLDVGDALQDLTHKTVSLCRWALEHGYDYIFKVDLDTLVRPVLLMTSGFEKHNYSGGQFGGREFASGGAGYWLSRKAMGIVVEEVTAEEPWEDYYVANALLKRGIAVHNNPQHKFLPGARWDENTIAVHLSSIKGWGAKSTPQEMYDAYVRKPQRVLRRPPR